VESSGPLPVLCIDSGDARITRPVRKRTERGEMQSGSTISGKGEGRTGTRFVFDVGWLPRVQCVATWFRSHQRPHRLAAVSLINFRVLYAGRYWEGPWRVAKDRTVSNPASPERAACAREGPRRLV